MPGYASGDQYEAELLNAYRRSSRLPTIQKRDVNLALSIYKAPSRFGGRLLRPRKLVGKKLNYGRVRNILGANPSDSRMMQLATTIILSKDRDRLARKRRQRRRR